MLNPPRQSFRSLAALSAAVLLAIGVTVAVADGVSGPTAASFPGSVIATPVAPASGYTGGRVISPVVSPAAGETVSGFISIEVEPNGPADAMKWFIDGVEIGFDGNGEPWTKGWDSRTVADGVHEVYSKTRQPASSPDAGRWFRSPSVSFVVDNSSVDDGAPQVAPTDDRPGWRHLFADDFTEDVALGDFPAQVSDKWGAYPAPWKDTSKKGMYDPQRVVSVQDGVLRKDLRTVDGQALVAALLPKVTDEKPYGTLYGRYEVRFRTDRVDGYKIAWLLWPDTGTNITGSASGVGGNGEIDFPELNLNSSAVQGFVHFQDATRRDDQYTSKTSVDVSDWHTYTIEWSPDLVVFLLDGVEVGRTTERIPNTPMHWVLQTETAITRPTPATAAGTLEIDWVSMWAYDSAATGDDPVTSTSAGSTVLPKPANVADASQAKWYARLDGSWKQVGWDDGSKGWTPVWNTTNVAPGTYRMFTKVRNSSGWVTSRTFDFVVG